MQNIIMNQILFSKYNKKDSNKISISAISENNFNPISNPKKIFISLLIFSLCVFVIIIAYLSYSAYLEHKREKIYSSLSNDYNISKLYSNNIITQNTLAENQPVFTIIGIIKIDKIKISYPILSIIDDELLKIGPCRFSGPTTANTTGNLCIAAHNYNDNRFFSNISKLNINDEIQIFDSNGKIMNYKVFDKYETATNDTSCTTPLGNSTIEITLITCNNLTGNRIIVKAKSIMT